MSIFRLLRVALKVPVSQVNKCLSLTSHSSSATDMGYNLGLKFNVKFTSNKLSLPCFFVFIK